MKKTIGAFEKVSFPDFGLYNVIAKIDTGATSGSLHATRIKEIKLPTGETALRFLPYGKKKRIIVNSFDLREVRSSNGASSLWRARPTARIIRSDPMTIMCAASRSGTACSPSCPEP